MKQNKKETLVKISLSTITLRKPISIKLFV